MTRDEKLAIWMEKAKQLKELKAEEMTMRKELLVEFFPDAKIGTSTAELGEGWKVKGVYKLDYKVDEAALEATAAELALNFNLTLDNLIKRESKLINAGYKVLSAEAKQVMDLALVIKPGSPSLKIEPPKSKEK